MRPIGLALLGSHQMDHTLCAGMTRTGLYPAVVVHGLADARTALAVGAPVTLLSAAGAALYAGCGWWRALIARARAESRTSPSTTSSIAPMRPAWHWARSASASAASCSTRCTWLASVAAIAASLGGEVLTSRPPALDMADRVSRSPATRLVAGANHPG